VFIRVHLWLISMRIVLAPDKFKGCLSAEEVCRAMSVAIRAVDPRIEIDAVPMADGGEGTVSALASATGGRLVTRRVTGPLPEMKVDATFGILPDRTAAIEMSAASGLALLRSDQYDPLATTTFGTGELINHAIEEFGIARIILGIGGSATLDAGIGCAQACGLPVILEGGEPTSLSEPLCGRDVARVVLVKHGRGDKLGGVEVLVASDVTNPLYGQNGAARVFGPQKGATPQVVEQLDTALRQLAQRLGEDDVAQRPGAGAAGGLGFGMIAFFGAILRSGVEIVIEATKLRDRLRGADLCLTGEGRLDAQSAQGKTIAGVARVCHEANVPCVALVGALGEGADELLKMGLTSYQRITDPSIEPSESMRRAPELLAEAARKIVAEVGRAPGLL
jgi:glycerate kinase